MGLSELRRSIVVLLGGALCSACMPRVSTLEPYRHDPTEAYRLQQRANDVCRSRRGGALPPHPFTTDGCSLWPDGSWVSCCLEHDIAYWCGGSAAERERADDAFEHCVAANGSQGMGVVMVLGVRAGGFPWYPWPFRWGYGWDWPHGYDDAAPEATEFAPVGAP